jgi:hypothetical protein
VSTKSGQAHSRQFDWRNLSRGAKQLAVALLVDHLPDSRLAAELHQGHKVPSGGEHQC